MDDENDSDSLFGSPPPSPQRGRSPLLALPEDSGWRMEDALLHTQNVGTIALPGSQNNFSEIPVQSAPLNLKPPFLKLRPASIEGNHRVEAPSHSKTTSMAVTPIPTPRVSRPKPLARKHSERMDRTLSDLVSLIANFGPTQSIKLPVSVSSNPNVNQEGTKENPIQVEGAHDAPTPIDAVNNALIALASTVASALKLPSTPQDHPPLSGPAVHQVLQLIKHDPKLIPTLQATHEYLDSIPRYSRYETLRPPKDAAPSRSRRKRKQVSPRIPAGAEYWDVPFPFAPGHEPAGYPTQWQLERGRRVLGELLGLFERAFVQSRVKSSLTQETPLEPPVKRLRTSSAEPALSNEGPIDMQPTPAPGLDSRRMTDWLSSISVPSTESIIESSSVDVPYSESLVSPVNFSLDDISNMMDIYVPDVVTSSQPPIVDFTQLFDTLDWQSLNSIPGFDSVPSSNPLASIHMTTTDSAMAGADSASPMDSLSVSLHPEGTPPVLTEVPRQQDSVPSGACVGLDSIESKRVCHIKAANTQQPCGIAHSMQTILTTSGSSSVREGTPGSLPSEAMEVQSVSPSSKSACPTQLQRKATLLLKVQEYRTRLARELEKAALERWELQIESGVLLNLKKSMGGGAS